MTINHKLIYGKRINQSESKKETEIFQSDCAEMFYLRKKIWLYEEV